MEEKTARTYRLNAATIEQIDRLTRHYEVHQSEIVEQLLQKALAEVKAGHWRIKCEPVKYRVKIE